MLKGERPRGEVWTCGRIRSRQTLLPDKLRDVVDHAVMLGWHECDDRYCIRREQGQDFSSDFLLILTLEGEGEANVEDEQYRLTPGTVMIFPNRARLSYDVPTGGKWEFYWIHMGGPNCRAMLGYIQREYGRCFEVSCQETLEDCFELLLTAQYRYYEYEFFAAKVISRMLFALVDGVRIPQKEFRHRRQLVLQAIEAIDAHFSEPLQIGDVAAQLYLSTEHLIRVFHEETGMTPYQYLRQLRLRKACAFLEEKEWPIGVVASAVGYRSVSAFIAQFREFYGITPGMYRRFCTAQISER